MLFNEARARGIPRNTCFGHVENPTFSGGENVEIKGPHWLTFMGEELKRASADVIQELQNIILCGHWFYNIWDDNKSWSQQTFSVKGQVISILGLTGQVSVAVTQPYHCRVKADTDNP